MIKNEETTTPHPQVIFFDLGDTLVTKKRQWVPSAQHILQRFTDSPFRIGIISNTGQLDRSEVSSLLPVDFEWSLFEDLLIILSAEAGVEKPNPEIFKLAIARAGVPANLCLFCTENLHHTLIAQSLGLRTIRIESFQEKDLLMLADFFIQPIYGILNKEDHNYV